jgi:O-antigen ligase
MIQNRMSALLELPVNGKNYDRIYMWESAWQQFKSSPVLGDRFINNIDKTYSHNIILDSLMSTGLLGTIPFLFYLAMPFLMFYKLNKTRKRQLLIVFILFLATFMLSMTSGGLFTVSEFWILSALIIGLCSSPKTLKLTT